MQITKELLLISYIYVYSKTRSNGQKTRRYFKFKSLPESLRFDNCYQLTICSKGIIAIAFEPLKAVKPLPTVSAAFKTTGYIIVSLKEIDHKPELLKNW